MRSAWVTLSATAMFMTPAAAFADGFSLSQEQMPNDVTAAVAAAQFGPAVEQLLGPGHRRPCPLPPILPAAQAMCDGPPAPEWTRVATRSAVIGQQAAQAKVDALRNLPDADFTVQHSGSCMQNATAEFERADRLDAFLAGRPAHGPERPDEISTRWINGLTPAQRDAEFPQADLDRMCKDTSVAGMSPMHTPTGGLLRARFLRGDDIARSWLATQCERGATPLAIVRDLVEWANRVDLDYRKAFDDVATFATLHSSFLGSAARKAPAACGHPTTVARRASCSCISSLEFEIGQREADRVINPLVAPRVEDALEQVRSWVGTTGLSAPARAALTSALAAGSINLTAFDSSDSWNALMGASSGTMHVNAQIAAAAEDPSMHGALRATLTHEIGHYVAFLLQGGGADCAHPLPDATRCSVAKQVASALSAADLARLTSMRDCMDRNFIAGEWRSADARMPGGAARRLVTDVTSKREEYFADFVMRGATRRAGNPPRLGDLRYFCPAPDVKTVDYLDDSHGEPMFRIANSLNTAPLGPPGREPPLACEQELSRAR